MTRYLTSRRQAGLAGLVSLAVLAFCAAPAGAKLVCPKGTSNRIYCTHKLSLSVSLKFKHRMVTVTISVSDPHVVVALFHKGKVVKPLFNGNRTGKFTVEFKEPTKRGTYVLAVQATSGRLSKTVRKTIKVK